MFRKVKLSSLISEWVSTYPKVFILIPLLITFLIASPSLLSKSACYESSNAYLSRTLVLHENSVLQEYDYALTNIIIQPNDESNALSKSFLIEALAAQTRILSNISEDVIIHSPFDAWNNDIEMLRKDKMPLHTVDEKLPCMPSYLFQGLVKVNGHVSLCKRLSISILVPFSNSEIVTKQLEENLRNMKKIEEVSKFYVFQDDLVLPSESSIYDRNSEVLKVTVSKLTIFDCLVVLTIYFFIFSVFFYTLKETKIIKFKFGMSLAIVAQGFLVLFAAKSITCFLFKSSTDNIPWELVYLPVTFCSVSNMMKVLMDKKTINFVEELYSIKKKDELNTSTNESFSFSFADKDFFSNNTTLNGYALKETLSTITLIALLFPFSRKVTCFFITALILNFVLQTTYFSAVLSLDHRRHKHNEHLLSLCGESNSVNLSLGEGVNPKTSTWKRAMKTLIKYSTWLPQTEFLSTSAIFTALYMAYLNVRFASVRSSSSILYKMFYGGFTNFFSRTVPFTTIVFDKRSVLNEIVKRNKRQNSINQVLLSNPLFVIKDKTNDTSLPEKSYEEVSKLFYRFTFNTYRFDLIYFVEFCVFIVLLSFSILLVLQLITRKIEHYNSKLSGSFPKENTTKVSINKELTTPVHCANINAFRTKELSLYGHKLDIFTIITSQAPFVVSVGIDHRVLIWSPLSKPMPPPMKVTLPSGFWPVTKGVLSNDGTFIAFFNNSGKITCWSRQTMSFIWEINTGDKGGSVPLEAFFRKRTVPGFMKRKAATDLANTSNKKNNERRNSAISIKSVHSISSKNVILGGGLDARYENFSSELNEDTCNMVEFIFIMPCGSINIVDNTGKMKTEELTKSDSTVIHSCKRLITPRMNERLVLIDNAGDLHISTVVNNRWKTRKLIVLKDYFNKGRGLMTPLMLNMEHDEKVYSPQEKVFDTVSEGKEDLLLIPFVGMILRTKGNEAELVDVQSGTMVKKFALKSYKQGSLRIFHDQPVHCRFCGSASVATLSVAYTSVKNSFIMHTFQLESRTKTSICLRVERDPREIRCLGIDAVVEKRYSISNVDLWDVTENNMVIGIRRKDDFIGKYNETLASNSTAVSFCASEHENQTHIRKNNNKLNADSDSFKIHNVWEGWTMNAYGKVLCHEIPTGMNGLLVNKVGPLAKFGTKSIVVAFGNIMKIFYLGNEEFLLETNSVGVNEENSGLRFVNKRRERLVHKINTNYSEVNSA